MRRILFFLSVSIALSLLTIFALERQAPSSWDAWQPATCMPTKCFCEAVDTAGPIRQRVNTSSSLSFIFSGFLIIALYQSRKWSKMSALSPSCVALLACSSIIIGVGSAFFHASLTLVGQFFDVFGMYLLASLMLSYGLKRLWDWRNITMLNCYIVLTATLSILLIVVPETRRYLFALVIILSIIVEVLVRRSKQFLIETIWWNIAFLFFVTGYIVWILDNFKVVCAPNSLLQGHSIWHIFGAIAVVFLYRYYASERLNAG